MPIKATDNSKYKGYPFTPHEQRGAAVMMSDWVMLRYEEAHHQEMDHVLSGSRFGVG